MRGLLRGLTVLLVSFAVTGSASGEEPPEYLREQLGHLEEWQERNLAEGAKHLRELRGKLLEVKRDPRKRREVLNEIRRTERTIGALEKWELPLRDLDLEKPEKGQLGYLNVNRLEVAVVGEERLLVVPVLDRFRLDPSSRRQEFYEAPGKPLLVYGLQNRGEVVTGQELRPEKGKDLFEILGVEKYPTLGRVQTLAALRWYDVEGVGKLVKEKQGR